MSPSADGVSPQLATEPRGGEAERLTLSTAIDRYRWALLAVVTLVGAVIRAHGFTSGSLYQDDAWVALPNLQPLGTAIHMTVSAPGFMLFERFWTGLLPHTTWWAQLPSYLASVGGIIAIFGLVRYLRFAAWIALLCALLLAVSNEATTFATHLKPYPFDLLLACGLLWLGERARRNWSFASLAVFAVASVLACGWSFILVLVVLGIDLVLAITVVRRRSMALEALGTCGVALLVTGILYEVAIKGQVTPRLRSYWRTDDLHTGSLHALVFSIRSMVHGILGTQLSVATSPTLGGVTTAEAVLFALAITLGIICSWRRCALAIGVLVATLAAWAVTVIPLGSDRTEAYLYPALLLLVAGGLRGGSTLLQRHAPTIVVRIATAVVALGAVLLLLVALLSPPTYPGGRLPGLRALFGAGATAEHTVVIVEPGTVYPWVYDHDPTATVIFSPQFSTGFNFTSTERSVFLMWDHPGDARFNQHVIALATPAITRLVTVGYLTAFDVPQHEATVVALRALCWTPVTTKTADRYRVTVFTRLTGCTPTFPGEHVEG